MKIRTHEENLVGLYGADIIRHHITMPHFDVDEIRKTKAYIRFHASEIKISEHFTERCSQKHIPAISLRRILKFGKCFEYKMDKNNKLFRLAIRVEDFKGLHDYIFVLQPEFEFVDGIRVLVVKFITAYTNNPNDEHSTLDKSNYCLEA